MNKFLLSGIKKCERGLVWVELGFTAANQMAAFIIRTDAAACFTV